MPQTQLVAAQRQQEAAEEALLIAEEAQRVPWVGWAQRPGNCRRPVLFHPGTRMGAPRLLSVDSD